MKLIACWCVPEKKAYFFPPGTPNPCTWPECLNGDRPDPHTHDGELITEDGD